MDLSVWLLLSGRFISGPRVWWSSFGTMLLAIRDCRCPMGERRNWCLSSGRDGNEFGLEVRSIGDSSYCLKPVCQVSLDKPVLWDEIMEGFCLAEPAKLQWSWHWAVLPRSYFISPYVAVLFYFISIIEQSRILRSRACFLSSRHSLRTR
jgi:hypothetical protein